MGWEPEPGWLPNPSWPEPPAGWSFWVSGDAGTRPLATPAPQDHRDSQLAGTGGYTASADSPAGATPSPATSAPARAMGPAAVFGWGGVAITLLVGALGGGVSGAASSLGLYLLVVALVALARGRVRWARLGSRAAGGAALGAALVAMTVGAVAAPATPPTSLAAGPTPTVAIPSPTPPTQATGRTSATPSVAAAPSTTTTADVSPSKAPATVTPTVDPVAAAVAQAHRGTALAAVAALTVKGRGPMTGYDRALFGAAWTDSDRNGCDQRNDILRRDLRAITLKANTHGCTVMTGTLHDPYTGNAVAFRRTSSSYSPVQIDHVVPLADAWVKGAATWSAAKRTAFATDPLNLLAVGASVNAAKGAGDAATWLPPVKSYRCSYAARQVAVKQKYHVAITGAERTALVRVLGACPTMSLPAAKVIALGGAPVYQPPVTTPRPTPIAKPTPTPAPKPPAPKPAPQPPRPAPQPPTTVDGVHPARSAHPRAPSDTRSRAPSCGARSRPARAAPAGAQPDPGRAHRFNTPTGARRKPRWVSE